MIRFLALTVVAVSVSACAMQMPSFSTAFGGGDQDQPRSQPAAPAKQRKASAGSGIGGIWDSVASPFRKSKAEDIAYTASHFNPKEAQNIINAYRASKGLKPLVINAKLNAAAQAHSLDLAQHDRISHFGSDGSDIEERARRAGYVFHLIAENIGTGQMSAAEVIEGWERSPTHNENLLLADAEDMGIALVYRPETQFKTFWTLVVGRGS